MTKDRSLPAEENAVERALRQQLLERCGGLNGQTAAYALFNALIEVLVSVVDDRAEYDEVVDRLPGEAKKTADQHWDELRAQKLTGQITTETVQ
jgi:hypothetical protein